MNFGTRNRSRVNRLNARTLNRRGALTAGFVERDPGVHFLAKPFYRHDLALKVRAALEDA